MPEVKINGVDIFYKITGDGDRVLVILNGIMMSAESWGGLLPSFTKAGYRVLNVDFRDQGKSQSSPVTYTISQHVEDLKGLLEHLGIAKCNLMGISYGGQVSMLFALTYPHMLETLILANTMARLTQYLIAIGESWDEAAKLKDGKKFFRLAMPLIYSDTFYEKNWKWLKDREELFSKILTAEWFERYLRLSSSHGDYDIVQHLTGIEVPTLVIASDKDIITPYHELLLIHEGIKDSKFIIIPEAGHASCYEKMEEFILIVLGFLAIND
ncbi:alpha/beta fold hydrolase [Alkaliphilus peptidifermentans]|uniref:Pimeloyl-ACP methyl ester carboxylesterase n=1 Tax=Alkaliphilus peptidifermentans DSM 18978 TaxID=1120976 RepID=A0A1G5ABS4_9FIRM|nr:alpha/beta hydrolase [Alkaliphilus peptidifermentans]SCX75360.1 Pimeloyl-ACP methyl ester carboxylesterase [Alkaliphilus peptidifermentans DSM 18978]